LSGRDLAALVCAGMLAFTAGCASRTERVAVPALLPARRASLAQLVTLYNRQASAIRTLAAAVRMEAETGSAFSSVIKKYREIGGFIVAAQPSSIRVVGQAPVVGSDLFDMVSDGKTFRMYIPSKKRFLVGPASLEQVGKKPLENLRPEPLLQALLWPEIAPAQPVVVEQEIEQDPPSRDYVLTVMSGEGHSLAIERRIWFDRADLRVSRIEIFGPSGRLESDVRYADWTGEPAFPRDIRLTRAHEDYSLRIRINRLTLNQPVPASRFELAQPAGTRLVRVPATGGKP
jgi:outer membrane lipoprotein-sorting protein